MTISYGDQFFKILFIWRGSIYKAVLKDVIFFLVLWYAVFFTNMFALNDAGKVLMTEFSKKIESQQAHIPLSFLLGFFVDNAINRWWQQAELVEKLRPERLICILDGCVRNNHRKTNILQKFARWTNLMAALAWIRISDRTKKRFPTNQHLVDAGLMTEKELEVFHFSVNPHGRWIQPSYWMQNKLKLETNLDAREFVQAHEAIIEYTDTIRKLLNYDWIKIPLLYVQIATIATYAYMIICVFGHQNHLDKASLAKIHLKYNYFPGFTIVLIVFYMGWLKVGQFLSNPFGEDDDDFEMNYILDRNVYYSYESLKELDSDLPADHDTADTYDTSSVIPILPHTRASIMIKDVLPPIHTDNIVLNDDQKTAVMPDDYYTDHADVHNPCAQCFKRVCDTICCRQRSNQSRMHLNEA